ncbi:hypothetical protein HDV57DRAFT_193376 [Trichoderma longibrachiatum]|uniref:Uncharacterized protein n=1 Tax=Trichoderma longibrachiatum ATCC 18648 TaxID=983965 RepID=A0A2T4C8R9_TRILO|nr:hypothetical protein M440DRAFT_1229053 [Trichoderma longibrachiatum ATCC 18648]
MRSDGSRRRRSGDNKSISSEMVQLIQRTSSNGYKYQAGSRWLIRGGRERIYRCFGNDDVDGDSSSLLVSMGQKPGSSFVLIDSSRLNVNVVNAGGTCNNADAMMPTTKREQVPGWPASRPVHIAAGLAPSSRVTEASHPSPSGMMSTRRKR